MTSNAFLLRIFPLLLFAGIALLAWVLHFNGLYGQDAHEYLRQSREIVQHLTTGQTAAPAFVSTDFASGYPIAGAVFRFFTGDAILGLQVVSWLSFAISVWLLERILFVLTHGSRADSRLIFSLLGLALAPYFLRAGLSVMTDSLGLAMALAAFYFALRWVEHERGMDAVGAAVFIVLAVSVRIGLAGLLLPLAVAVVYFLVERGKWRWLVASGLAGGLLFLPHFWLAQDVVAHPFQHSDLHWSVGNFFRRSFSTENGLSTYWAPNILYLFFPLIHPGFCLVISGLFLLAKRTDWALPAKKVLLCCIGCYLLLLGGLPHQNMRFLLPVYALVLLLLFPAWDRMYCYGLYFFRRLTWTILGVTLFCQVFFSVKTLRPTLQRNHLETTIAESIKSVLPAGATVYGFDLDIAMKSYLPDIQFVNLWERRYSTFQEGSFMLFNEPALRPQWDGLNPMLNWDFATANYAVDPVKNLPDGWVLYQIGAPMPPSATEDQQ